MSFDDQFTQVLRDAAELAPSVPGAVLAGGAQQRGRRRRTRRRAALAGGAVALALAGLGATQLGTSSNRVSPSGGRSSTITGAFMLSTFKSVLPPGRYSGAGGYGIGETYPKDAGPTAHMLYDDGHGAAMIELSTDRVNVPLTATTQGTQCMDPFSTPTQSCRRTVRPDGSVLVVDKLAPYDPVPVTSWIAIYTGTDGRQVRIDEFNSTSAGPPLTRTYPPLSSEQLTAAVTSSAWDPVFAQFRRGSTEQPAPAGSTVPTPAPSAILATVGGLLPQGARHDNGGTQTTVGDAHLSVTFGGRTSMLEVMIYPQWQQGQNSDPRRTFEAGAAAGTLTRTADGASVITSTSGATKSGGGPAVQWHVDALLANGTRVEVGEWNGANGYEFKPGTPALTMDQLKAIAVAPVWRG